MTNIPNKTKGKSKKGEKNRGSMYNHPSKQTHIHRRDQVVRRYLPGYCHNVGGVRAGLWAAAAAQGASPLVGLSSHWGWSTAEQTTCRYQYGGVKQNGFREICNGVSSRKWTTRNAAQALSQFHSPLLLDIMLLKYIDLKRVASNGSLTLLTAVDEFSVELNKLVTNTYRPPHCYS